MIVNLSSVIPDGLVCPEGKRRIEYVDKGRTGLYLEVKKSSKPGYGAFYLRYKDANGVTRHIKLGDTETVTLETAREKAKKLKAEITLGADPRAESDARKAVPTFSEFFVDMYMPFAKQRKRTASKDMEYYRLRLCDRYGRTRLNAIRKRDLQLFHSSLHDEGLAPATCNHYLKLMKRCLNLAIQWEVIEGPNPAVGIQQFRERQIEQYLDQCQLKRLLEVLAKDKNRMVCDIVLFLLSTGARLNEALQARWEHIDIEHRVWRVPATNSKSGKVRAVPLNDSAIDVLNEVGTKDKSEWVFPSKRNHGQPFVSLQKTWDRLRKKAGLGHVRIHDLRHQYASMLVNGGRTLYEVQQILGHSTPKVTMRYSHLSTATLQSASASASDVIKEAMKKAG